MEMNGVKEICVLGFLGINSWIDIRKKQVALLLIIIFAELCGQYIAEEMFRRFLCAWGQVFSLC